MNVGKEGKESMNANCQGLHGVKIRRTRWFVITNMRSLQCLGFCFVFSGMFVSGVRKC